MRRLVTGLLLLLAIPLAAGAQTPDSTAGRGAIRREVRQAVERERRTAEERQLVERRLRNAIQQRFTQRVATELNLQEKQLAELRATSEKYAGRREELSRRTEELRTALRGELRPGVAANDDSVERVVKELTELQVQRARLQQEELDDLSGFLTPVQRARYLVMQQRLRQLIERAAERRASQRDHSSQE
ncbi:MAG TPA: Spy/CpxP family protein refolding chaperone [Gemmatimonadales bacterium]|jgi:hypothetical protein|nr:Spy/CpxP family protein refolding chaperone [Gemmatimonadales bacterium]